uniref:YbbR-like domain-containing protein n=1 Tax=Caldisericum exile TaxID=693075 RepID=A0A7C4TW30_9BACT
MKFLKGIFNIKVLSVIFAIGLWYYISVTQGPVITKTFNNVPVVPINIPPDSYVSNSIQNISVVIEGPSKIVLGMRDSDFIASVDLSNKKEGDFLLPVEVKTPTSVVKVKSFSPEKLRVVLESISTKKFPVVCEFANTTQSERYPSIPIISPPLILISGPMSSLSNIKRVFVTVDLSKISGTTTLTLPVQAETSDGSTLKNVYFNPSTVVVTVNPATETGLLTLPIVPNISNTPPSNFGIRSATVSPSVITISGPISIISTIKSITTEPIDVSSIFKKTEVTTKLAKISGVTFPFDSCKVTVDIQPLVSRVFTIPVDVIPPQTKQYTLTQTNVNITVLGFKDVIDAIPEGTIKCSVDLSTFDTGTYTIPVSITSLPQGIILQSMVPSSIEVKIY